MTLALLAAGTVALVPASAAGAKGSAKHSVSYFAKHPCSLITRAEVQSVYGQPIGPGQVLNDSGYGGSCQYATTGDVATDNLSFSMETGTAASAKSVVKGPYKKESKVGHNAYCDGTGNVRADIGNLNGSPESIDIAASGCATAVEFAKDAFKDL